MEKNSGVGSILSTAYVGSEAIKGAKESKRLLKNPNVNKFDEILKNTPQKTISTFKMSSAIDELYLEKLSYENNQNNEDKKKKRNIAPYIIGASILGAGAAEAIKTGNPLRPLRTAGKALKEFGHKLPKAVLGRSGKPIFEGLRKSKQIVQDTKKFDKALHGGSPQNLLHYYLPGVVFGGGMGASNLAVHLLGDKYFDKKVNRKSYNNFPSPSVQIYRKRKSASDMIDNNFMEKIAQLKGKAFAKKLFVEDFLQNSLKTIPFALTPIAVSHAMNRNLKTDFSPIRGSKAQNHNVDKIIIEVPREKLIKTANVKKNFQLYKKLKGKNFKGFTFSKFKPKADSGIESWENFAKYRVPEGMVRSLSWFGVPAAITALTGRNIKGLGEKVKKHEDIDPDKVRITVDRGSEYDDANKFMDASRMSRMADTNELFIEKKSSVTKDIDKIVKNILSENKKLKSINPRVITQGIQKNKKMLG